MGFGEMGVLLISETIISTQTAVAAPPDPISESGKSLKKNFKIGFYSVPSSLEEDY